MLARLKELRTTFALLGFTARSVDQSDSESEPKELDVPVELEEVKDNGELCCSCSTAVAPLPRPRRLVRPPRPRVELLAVPLAAALAFPRAWLRRALGLVRPRPAASGWPEAAGGGGDTGGSPMSWRSNCSSVSKGAGGLARSLCDQMTGRSGMSVAPRGMIKCVRCLSNRWALLHQCKRALKVDSSASSVSAKIRKVRLQRVRLFLA